MSARLSKLILLGAVLLLLVPAAAEALTWGTGATASFRGGYALISCPAANSCVVINDGNADTFNPADPKAAVEQAIYPQNGYRALSCPTTSFCVTLGRNGQLATFEPRHPGRETSTGVAIKATALVCSSRTQCTLAGLSYDHTPEVLTLNPTRLFTPGVGSPGDVQFLPHAIACASATQCTIAGSRYVDTFDPRNLRSQISGQLTAGSIQAITCSSTSECTVAGQGQHVVAFNPRTIRVSAPAHAIAGNTVATTGKIVCITTSDCIVGSSTGALLEGNPHGQQKWVVKTRAPLPISDVSCPSAKVCIAVDTHGDVFTAPAPASTSGRTSIVFAPTVGLTGAASIDRVRQTKNELSVELGCVGAKAVHCSLNVQLRVAHDGDIAAQRSITIGPGHRTITLGLTAKVQKLRAHYGTLAAHVDATQKIYGGSIVILGRTLTLGSAAH